MKTCKNISLSDEAYEKISAWKATGQSFSGAILDGELPEKEE